MTDQSIASVFDALAASAGCAWGVVENYVYVGTTEEVDYAKAHAGERLILPIVTRAQP